MASLHRSGWTIGDCAVFNTKGETVWIVSGRNGENLTGPRERPRDGHGGMPSFKPESWGCSETTENRRSRPRIFAGIERRVNGCLEVSPPITSGKTVGSCVAALIAGESYGLWSENGR